MPFPESERVIFNHNPLEEVICQLQFPTILRIERELPSEYQESLRQDYPIYTESRPDAPEFQLGEAGSGGGQAVRLISRTPSHAFHTEQKDWTITLAKEFIAISTRCYGEWDEFKHRLEEAVGAFVGLYEPAYYSRIGLRYRDVVQRSQLGLKDVPWRDLLKPAIAGELLAPELDEIVTHAARQLTVALEPSGRQVNLRHGLATNAQANERVFVFDADFFVEGKTEVQDASESLLYFNQQAGRLFRWCITPRLHDAMEPRPPSSA